ncbi:MAG TPA: sugar phosphate isomerase/epimerase [Candidatus Acidoferrum sp.]|jgi:inosose dehydratase|nr:sugar phosphate isomerase/epimerase [Candidatus Acidoferrum sp.]
MTAPAPRFLFASAPDSWGVLDYDGPSWKQSYEKMLDEMVEAGYTGTELGPYGYFPTDPELLRAQLEKRKLKLLGSFVPVKMGDLNAEKEVIERIRKVGDLLAKLKAPFLVLADDQTPGRNAFSGRASDPACPKLNAEQWKHVGKIVSGAEKVANEFGLDLVFHPHVATYVETSEETEKFFDATSHTGIGLCLDSGHAYYAGADPVKEAEKFKSKLRFVHIKDCDQNVLVEARKNKWTFEEAIEHKVFTIIGKGNLDFPAFFRTLKKNNYSGWAVVEQDVKFDAYAIPPAVSVAESLAYLHGVVGSLENSAAAR